MLPGKDEKLEYYSPKEVREITGASKTNLVYWSQIGIITPIQDANGRGSSRLYSFRNLIDVAICQALHDLSIESTQIKRIIGTLQNEDLTKLKRLHVTVDGKKADIETETTILHINLNEILRSLDEKRSRRLA